MKNITLLQICLLLLLSFSSVAQKASFDWGPSNKKVYPGKTLQHLLGNNQQYYYVVNAKHNMGRYYTMNGFQRSGNYLSFNSLNQKIFVRIYNDKHKLIKEKEWDYVHEGLSLNPSRFFKTKSETFLLLEAFNKEKQQIQFYISSVNEMLEIVGTPKKIMTSKFTHNKVGNFIADFVNVLLGGGMGFQGIVDNDNIAIKTSADSSKIMLSGFKDFDATSEKQLIWVKVFDENFKVLWEREVTTEHSDSGMALLQYQIDNEGTVYISASYPRKGSKKATKGLTDRLFKIYTLNKDKYSNVDLTLEAQNSIMDARFQIVDNQTIVIAGTYNEKETKPSKANGLFFIRMQTKDGEMQSKEAFPFSSKLIAEFNQYRNTKKKNKDGIRYLGLDQLIQLKDGSLVILAEERLAVAKEENFETKSITFHSNSILAGGFSPEGKQLWVEQIDKRFRHMDWRHLSFLPIQHGNDLLFVHNHVLKGEGWVTSVSGINSEGKIIRPKIIDHPRKTKCLFITGNAKTFQDGVLLGGSWGLKKYRYGQLRLR